MHKPNYSTKHVCACEVIPVIQSYYSDRALHKELSSYTLTIRSFYYQSKMMFHSGQLTPVQQPQYFDVVLLDNDAVIRKPLTL